ncbi:MAG TPA: 6-carboxytetrahydropterin synthase [Phycisphaerales bacterium]|nr:6-carboxytetrahydropterin synthase [Phycisphaerales bacterium]
MLRLTRAVRVAINPPGAQIPQSPNGFAGAPSMVGLGRHYEFLVSCRGEVDGASGYLIDIKAVDKSVRRAVLPMVEEACANNALVDPLALLARALPGLEREIVEEARRGPNGTVRLESVRWMLSPTYSVEMLTRDGQVGAVGLLRQRFDFAAAHRLNVPTLSPEKNRELFGKCNNPSGHGHNYQFEACVEVPVGDAAGVGFDLQTLERVAQRAIIDRFDHKHLNVDTEEFCVERGGVNPSVENIAKVFFGLLREAVAAEARGVALRQITVWETDRTSATYPA